MEFAVGVFLIIWLLGVIMAKLIKPQNVSTVDFIKNYDKPIDMSFNQYNNNGIRRHDPLPTNAEDIEFEEFFNRLSIILREDNTAISAIGKSGTTVVVDKNTDFSSLDFFKKVILMDTIVSSPDYKIYRDKIYNILNFRT